MPDFISANGPIWGPDFVIVTVEQGGTSYALQVYPDANNAALRAAGLHTVLLAAEPGLRGQAAR